MHLVRLTYASRVAQAFDTSDIDDILAVSRANNRQADITGVLYFSTGYFFQCLEGPQHDVNAVYAGIMRDPRHNDVTLLEYSDIGERQFGEWRMAYIGPEDVSEEQLGEHSGSIRCAPCEMTAAKARAVLRLLGEAARKQEESHR